jgi:hypothetical protein
MQIAGTAAKSLVPATEQRLWSHSTGEQPILTSYAAEVIDVPNLDFHLTKRNVAAG